MLGNYIFVLILAICTLAVIGIFFGTAISNRLEIIKDYEVQARDLIFCYQVDLDIRYDKLDNDLLPEVALKNKVAAFFTAHSVKSMFKRKWDYETVAVYEGRQAEFYQKYFELNQKYIESCRDADSPFEEYRKY